jgi:flagellar hook-associated protein 3 FlgL
MTQRITPQMQSSTLIANIDNQLTAMDRTQQQLSTGLRILQPSDDPYGTTVAMQLNSQISALDSYTSNVNDGNAWTNTASAALISLQQMVERVRELTVEGGNGTMSPSDLADAASEIDQLTDSIKETANTQYNGMYVFSGTATGTQPYATGNGSSDGFSGNTAPINRAIGPGTTLQVNADLSSVLGNGLSSGDGKLLDTLRTISQDMTSGNTSHLGADLTAIDSNISSLEVVQSNVGSTQDRLSMAATRIQSLKTTDQTQLSNTQDVDMAQASITFSTEQAGFSAALQSGAKIIQTSLLNFLQ